MKDINLLEGKVILITGGTGFLGQALTKEFLKFNPQSIRIFSRDEVKHHKVQELFKGETRIRNFIGDVRDYERLKKAMENVDIVIHAAALKRLDLLEYNVEESIKTNILGTIFQMFKSIDYDFWLQKGILKKELNSIIPPTEEEIKKVKPEVIYMSYFIPWSSVTNLRIAQRYGFRDLSHEWIREGYIENFEQIDSKAYLVHLWLKYPKFGFQRTSDIASRRVREGLLSLPEAKKLIKECDPKLDQLALDDFINSLGCTTKEFWDVVEPFWNREIFEKVDGVWNPTF